MTETSQSLVASTRDRFSAGHDIEAVLAGLRQEGCSMIDSIKIIRDALPVALGDAKRTVHCSQTWADRRAAHDALHDSLVTAAEDLGSQPGSELPRRESRSS